ncbi:glycine zipper family protein [Wolbachia endosymbiont of Protocalliphora sialia]
MVQGGTTNPTNSDEFIKSIVKYISGKKDLLQGLEDLLKLNNFENKSEISNTPPIDDMSKFLMENKNVFGDVIVLILENFEKNKVELEKFSEQVNKVEGMEKELETLGNQLLAQGLISGAAVTTLTGALAGLLTVGGVTGALIIGGAAFVGFVALVAIAAIGYLIYQNRGEIKEGAIKFGKAVKSFVKDVIDELTWEKINFSRLEKDFINNMIYAQDAEKSKEAQNKIRIIKMLKNEEQRSAIRELVKDGDIKEFLEKDMERLLQKGLSTHESDEKSLKELMEKFQPAIMAIGNNKIDEVEKKVNEKVQKIEPSPKLESSSAERVSEEGKEM